MNVVTLYGTAVNDPLVRQANNGKLFTALRMKTVSRDSAGKNHDDYHALVFWESYAEEVENYGIKKGSYFGVMGRLKTWVPDGQNGGRVTEVYVTMVYPPHVPFSLKPL